MLIRVVIIAGIGLFTAGLLIAPQLAGLIGRLRAQVRVGVTVSKEGNSMKSEQGTVRPLRPIRKAESNWSRTARLEALQ